MIVPKIIQDAVLVVAQNKMLTRSSLRQRDSFESQRYSPPSRLSGSSTNVPAPRLKRRWRTAQTNHSWMAGGSISIQVLIQVCLLKRVWKFSQAFSCQTGCSIGFLWNHGYVLIKTGQFAKGRL